MKSYDAPLLWLIISSVVLCNPPIQKRSSRTTFNLAILLKMGFRKSFYFLLLMLLQHTYKCQKKGGGGNFLQTSNEGNFFYTYWTRRKKRGNVRVQRSQQERTQNLPFPHIPDPHGIVRLQKQQLPMWLPFSALTTKPYSIASNLHMKSKGKL